MQAGSCHIHSRAKRAAADLGVGDRSEAPPKYCMSAAVSGTAASMHAIAASSTVCPYTMPSQRFTRVHVVRFRAVDPMLGAC